MTSNAIPLTTFERRLKAGIIIGAAALAAPLYGAIVAGVYALTAVTLTAMVCPRTWALRLSGHAMVLALSLLLDKHICSWAGYLPSVILVILAFLGYDHQRAVGRWRPGTDLLIARIVERGPRQQNPTHRISWRVYTNEDLDEDQFRTIFRKFCGGCPKPCFQQPWRRPPVVDICLRSVQFWYSSEEGRLLQRVSEWCAPRWHQPVEFEYRPSLPQRLDQFASDFFVSASLFVVLPVAVIIETDIVREWGLMDTGDKIFLTGIYSVYSGLLFIIGLPVAMVLEVLCGLCIRAAITSLTGLFESMRQFSCNAWSSIKGSLMAGVRGTKAAAKRIRSCFAWTNKTAVKAVGSIAKGTNLALNWMHPRISCTFDMVVNVGQAFATGAGQVLPVARGCLMTAWTIVDLVSTLILLLALSVVAALVSFLLVVWLGELVSEVRSGAGARLLRLWDVVTAVSLSFGREFSLESVGRAAGTAAVGAARASAIAAAIAVASVVARAFVLAAKAARFGCVCLVASGDKKRTLLRKARKAEAGRCCRRIKIVPVDVNKTNHGSPSALVAAACRDIVVQDGGVQQPPSKHGRINLAEVREVAKRVFLEQKSKEDAANSACSAKGGAGAPSARRGGPRRKSRAAVPVCCANASAPALRRSPRSRT
jgi:hypothetical protein